MIVSKSSGIGRNVPWKEVALLIAILTGMSRNAEADETAETISNIKSMAIISAIGDIITFASVGPFDFHRGAKTLSISNWGIDDKLERKVTDNLGQRFDFKQIAYDRSAFANEVSHPMSLDEPPIHELISKLSAPVDAYLVISKKGSPPDRQYLNLNGGINILEQTSITRKSVYALCILIQVQLIDAKTDKTIASDVIVVKPGIRYDDARNKFDPALWPTDGIDLTDDQETEIKSEVTAQLFTILDASLSKIGLKN